MNATVLNGARIGDGSILAAGAVVPEGREFPPRSLVAGVPARRFGEVTKEQTRNVAPGRAVLYPTRCRPSRGNEAIFQ